VSLRDGNPATSQTPSVARPADSAPAPNERSSDARFEQIFASEFDYVFHTLRRLGVRSAELPDVTHDVFVAVYRKLGDYDPDRPIRPWLFGFSFRIAKDHRALARHGREVRSDPRHGHGEVEAEELPDSTPDAEVSLDRKRSRDLVLLALDEMELEKRALVVMHDLDGLGVPAIAELLEIPLNTAYSRLRLARDQFRATLLRLRPAKGLP
jgi:RNA polymerase sigma-70 factor, ECF subfamily